MKLLLTALLFIAVTPVSAYEDSCIWDGEEYLKKPVLEDHIMWTRVVYDLHQEGDFLTGAFEGVGSCRFFDRYLGADFESALKVVEVKGYQTAVRAYFAFDGAGVNKMILPSAYEEAGTGKIIIKKDFYHPDKMVCKKQKEDLVDLGGKSSGIKFNDISVKRNIHGGVSAVINRGASSDGMYGVCHFH